MGGGRDRALLDVASASPPLDLAGIVMICGACPPYRIVIATRDGSPVRSESGVQLAADVSLAPCVRAPFGAARLLVGSAAMEVIER